MTYVHQLPAFRHPTTKSRAILSPVFGTNNFCVALFLYKKRDGRLVCDGHKSECMDWLKNNGFLKGITQ